MSVTLNSISWSYVWEPWGEFWHLRRDKRVFAKGLQRQAEACPWTIGGWWVRKTWGEGQEGPYLSNPGKGERNRVTVSWRMRKREVSQLDKHKQWKLSIISGSCRIFPWLHLSISRRKRCLGRQAMRYFHNEVLDTGWTWWKGQGWHYARRLAKAKVHRMERGVNVSAEWCLSLCDGPAMNWPLVRSVSAPSLQDSWDWAPAWSSVQWDGWILWIIIWKWPLCHKSAYKMQQFYLWSIAGSSGFAEKKSQMAQHVLVSSFLTRSGLKVWQNSPWRCSTQWMRRSKRPSHPCVFQTICENNW